ncbi:MAG: nitrogen regulation protein NR(I) [Pseudomonadota bacterium]
MTQVVEEIWLVDDDRSIRRVLEKAMDMEKLSYRSFEQGDLVLAALEKAEPMVLVTDIRMPGTNGFDLLRQATENFPKLPVIIMTAHSDLDSAVSAYQGGAFEYLPKPFDIDEAIKLIQRALEHRNTQAPLPVTAEDVSAKAEIIGEAPAMQEVFRAVGRLSQSHITVLINGESGTGKELVARALHQHSPRRNKTFIALNMAAIPKDLIESELFGHEKGAFTGATTQHQGRFEQTHQGTLFLDEIGDMPADTQTRLLRVLSNGEFYRVGGHTPIRVDVRIIAATHQNLEKLVHAGTFREDLFHRLNVIRVHLPRLSERLEDIPTLANHFLKKASKELGVEPKTLTVEGLQFLKQLPWPGNVRQLENTCRWLTVMAAGREILKSDFPPELINLETQPQFESHWEKHLRQWATRELSIGHKNLLGEAIPTLEKIMIEVALKYTTGKKREAATLLGWGRNTLTRKIKELKMDAGLVTEDDEDDDIM